MIRRISNFRSARLALALTSYFLITQAYVWAQTPPRQFTAVDIIPDATSSAIYGINAFQQAGYIGGFPGGVAAPANHAFVWSDVGQATVDLHPSFLDYPQLNANGNSIAYSTDTVNQVGYGYGAATSQRLVALRWSGTAASAEVLQTPFSNHGSVAYNTCGGQSVGYGVTVQFVNGRGTIREFAGPYHAVLWNSGSTVGIDLNNGAQATVATACYGNQQVGYGGNMDSSNNLVQPKAMMWFGNRNNFVWLHPNGAATSQAVAINGNKQVGHAEVQFQQGRQVAFNSRAVMWTGTAASAVTLPLPSGFIFNYYATAIFNNMIVGYGVDTNTNQHHALYWADENTPVVDLNQFLPAGYVDATATGIDANGRIVGTAYSGTGFHAMVWTPVP